jgi:SAM-dependent methyltransferase
MEALKGWVARIEAEGPAPMVERALLRVPLPPLTMEQARYRWGTMSQMNARYASAHSATTHQRLQGNPTEWYYYHSLYREARQGWAEVPVDRMEAWLRARPHLVVGDFGCGEAQLARNLPNVVHSFDHVAIDGQVVACDMRSVPLADESLDVAIFSLSLWGLNWEDYLREAARVLRLDGRIRIAASLHN